MREKAYITSDAQRGNGYVAEVVTEQDYHERGPHAHSFRTKLCESRETAESIAHGWAVNNGYTTVDGPENF